MQIIKQARGYIVVKNQLYLGLDGQWYPYTCYFSSEEQALEVYRKSQQNDYVCQSISDAYTYEERWDLVIQSEAVGELLVSVSKLDERADEEISVHLLTEYQCCLYFDIIEQEYRIAINNIDTAYDTDIIDRAIRLERRQNEINEILASIKSQTVQLAELYDVDEFYLMDYVIE
jgi:hypothetical protein